MEKCIHCGYPHDMEIVPCQFGEEWHCPKHIQQCAYCGFRGCYLEFVTYDICAECADKQIEEADAADIHPYYADRERRNAEMVVAMVWAVLIVFALIVFVFAVKGCGCYLNHS